MVPRRFTVATRQSSWSSKLRWESHPSPSPLCKDGAEMSWENCNFLFQDPFCQQLLLPGEGFPQIVFLQLDPRVMGDHSWVGWRVGQDAIDFRSERPKKLCNAQDHFASIIKKCSAKHLGVSENSGTPKSSILIGFSIIFTIHFGVSLFFVETPICWSRSFFLAVSPQVDKKSTMSSRIKVLICYRVPVLHFDGRDKRNLPICLPSSLTMLRAKCRAQQIHGENEWKWHIMSKSFSTSFSSPNLMKSVPKVCQMRKKKTNKQANKQKIWRSFQLNDSMTSDWILAIPQFYSHWVLVVSLGGHLSKGMTHLCLSYEYPGSNHLNVASWSSSKWKLVLFAPPKKAPKVVVIDTSWLMNCCQKKVCWKKCVLGDVSRCENVQNKYMFSRWSCWKFARKKRTPK